VAILGEIGIVPLILTTNPSINFVRKPSADRAAVGVCKRAGPSARPGRDIDEGAGITYALTNIEAGSGSTREIF
jgi:hypothetical protein